MTALLIGLFGALGSMLRYGANVWLSAATEWPVATWFVNVLGSCALGVVTEGLASTRLLGVEARLVLGTGLLGGFTTYSAFDIETLRMLERGEWLRGTGYVLATVFACLVSGEVGLVIGRALR
jgi:CrcB protein